MERRTLIAVALSFLVLYAYQAYFIPSTPPAARPAGQQSPAPATGATGSPTTPVTPQATVPAPATPPVSAVATVVGGTTRGDNDAAIETSRIQATFSARGARLTHWRLKQFRDDRGEPVDLIPTNVPADQPTPFMLRVDDPEITRRINEAVYRFTADATNLTLTFEFQDAAGLAVRKEFKVDPNSYVLSFSASVTNGDQALNPTVLWGPGLGDIGATSGGGSFFTGNYVQPPQAILNVDGDVSRWTPDDLATQPQHEGQFRFIGLDDHYFLAAALDTGQARVEFRPVSVPTPGSELQRLFVSQTLRFAQPPQNARFYFGPKQYDELRAIDIELVKAIHFGIFAWLVLPLLSGLKWIYAYVGNYGWAIIILTIIINLLIFPLRHKSVVAMRKMQMLQPQLKAIQDRYKDLKMTDPAKQKMNTEVMNLYREQGVNPASGCVPMLLTMPVLIAFYSLLSQAIELRGAPFMGWITDLSQHDRYYITPLLMGASMFWQAKITPTTADPAQQKMMLLMPVVFTGMFLWFPSGLAIYYFVSNMWTIGQQYVTNRLIGPPPVQAPRPPAERRLKNVGAGKTTAADKKS